MIQMSLDNGVTYDASAKTLRSTTLPCQQGDQIRKRPSRTRCTLALHRNRYVTIVSLIRIRQSFTRPAHRGLHRPPAPRCLRACFLLALTGIPLASRRGKSAAFRDDRGLAFIYWDGYSWAPTVWLANMNAVGVAVWIPNAVFAPHVIVLLTRLERPGDRDRMGRVVEIGSPLFWARRADGCPLPWIRFVWCLRGGASLSGPSTADGHVPNSFVFYFVILLVRRFACS